MRRTCRDLARLTLGFYLVFWGTLVLVIGLCESLTAITLRLPSMFLLGAGSLALAAELNIRLLWLPRQCSELNAMDHLWRHLKADLAANRQCVT